MDLVALLRGFGPVHDNMRNARLREVVEGLGFGAARTVVTSGNVVFDGPAIRSDRARLALESQLEAAWSANLGFTSSTIVRSRAEIDRMVESAPFEGVGDGRSSSCEVTFLKREPAAGLELPAGERARVVAVRDRAVYAVLDLTGPTPPYVRALDRTFGTGATTRTWKTLLRIHRAMASG